MAQCECLLAEVVRSLGFRHESRTLAVWSQVHGPSFTENQLLVKGLCTKGIYVPSDGGFRFLKSLTTSARGAGSIWPSEVCVPGASRGEHDLDFKEKESEGGQEGCEFLRWEPSGRGARPVRGQLPAGVFFAVFVGLAGASGPSSPCPANSVALESAVASGHL